MSQATDSTSTTMSTTVSNSNNKELQSKDVFSVVPDSQLAQDLFVAALRGESIPAPEISRNPVEQPIEIFNSSKPQGKVILDMSANRRAQDIASMEETIKAIGIEQKTQEPQIQAVVADHSNEIDQDSVARRIAELRHVALSQESFTSARQASQVSPKVEPQVALKKPSIIDAGKVFLDAVISSVTSVGKNVTPSGEAKQVFFDRQEKKAA